MTLLQIKQGLNKKIIQPIRMYNRRKKFRDKPVSIISINCIGGGISNDFGWEFLSPTINLFMYPDDFLTFCENLEECIELPLVFKEIGFSGKEYPIGEICSSKGNIEIHFLHYNSFEEAKLKWNERCKRVDKNNILLLFSDQNGCNIEHINRFDRLKYQKLFFTGNELFRDKYDYSVYVKPNKYEIENNINPIDRSMIFVGLLGYRRYEKNFNAEKFFGKLIENR